MQTINLKTKSVLMIAGSAPILPKDCRTMGCGKHAECVAAGDGYTCQCPSGMTGNPQVECSTGKSFLVLLLEGGLVKAQILISLLHLCKLSKRFSLCLTESINFATFILETLIYLTMYVFR